MASVYCPADVSLPDLLFSARDSQVDANPAADGGGESTTVYYNVTTRLKFGPIAAGARFEFALVDWARRELVLGNPVASAGEAVGPSGAPAYGEVRVPMVLSLSVSQVECVPRAACPDRQLVVGHDLTALDDEDRHEEEMAALEAQQADDADGDYVASQRDSSGRSSDRSSDESSSSTSASDNDADDDDTSSSSSSSTSSDEGSSDSSSDDDDTPIANGKKRTASLRESPTESDAKRARADDAPPPQEPAP